VEQVQRKEDQTRWQNRSIALPALRELRQGRGLSQRELGRLAGISPGTVYRLENMTRGAYPITVQKLASALRLPTADLVRDRRP
jgi:transcriptional regulator with XRE-family HTH domain